ncbi:hypothetical protein F1880_009753 [Penicillium rolfsii]|nr:hypothetical protein F1880_009753 [Penicillium rolfsii]
MAFPSVCSPRSARLLLTGTVETPTYASIKAKARPVVKEPPIYFPGLKPLARPWRLHSSYRPHVDDLKKKPLPVEVKQSPLLVPWQGGRQNSLTVSRSPPVSILKRAGASAKSTERHVSFGDVVVHEVERFPRAAFPPPRFAVFEPKRRIPPPPPPPPRRPSAPRVETTEELPRRQLHLEVTVRGPSWKEWIGFTACGIAFVAALSWLHG